MTKRLFAVDMGASGGKCFVGIFEDDSFSLQELHRFAHEGSSFFIADSTGKVSERTCWDDIFIYRNIIEGLQKYKRDIGDTLDSIGIDTWGADGQFINKNGDMLGKIYCYRDHRLDDMIEKVKKKIDPKRMYEITGIHFMPFNMSNQLHWYVVNRKEMLSSCSKFLPIPSIFYYYLGGIMKVDSSWASVTQLMDAKEKQWSKEILEKLDVPVDVMPDIVEPGTVVGELQKPLADSLDLNQAKLVAVGSHDTASAFASAPVENIDDALIISSGTWCIVGKLVPEPITSVEAMDANISNEGGIGNVRLLKNCLGMWVVQELRRIWRIADGEEMSWKELDELTEAAPAFSAFIDVDDSSFYNPANMECAIADFCKKTNQVVPSDRGTYIRVAYESLAMKYRMASELICSVSGGENKVVHIVGGGCKNILMNQCVADCLGLPVLAGPEEATAIGNIMVQAMGMGIIGSMHDALPIIKKAFPITEYNPQNTKAWDDAYEEYKSICD